MAGIDHKDLIGKSDYLLRMLAGDATHQHFKGGLYRYVGHLKDADTGEAVLGKDGLPRIVYQHVYPHERELWVRDHGEFFGIKDGKHRFRRLG